MPYAPIGTFKMKEIEATNFDLIKLQSLVERLNERDDTVGWFIGDRWINGHLYCMWNVSKFNSMFFWKTFGISTNTESAWKEMISAQNHSIDLTLFKIKKGWFKTGWAGFITLHFDKLQLPIGAIPVGKTINESVIAVYNSISVVSSLSDEQQTEDFINTLISLTPPLPVFNSIDDSLISF